MVVDGSEGEGLGDRQASASAGRPGVVNPFGKLLSEGSVLQPPGVGDSPRGVGGGFATPRPRLSLENLALFEKSPKIAARHSDARMGEGQQFLWEKHA